jgi:hypothetical protein
MEATLEELIKYLVNVSPAIWATLIRQVYSTAIVLMVFAAVCLSVARPLLVWAHKGYEWDRLDPVPMFAFFIAICLALVGVVCGLGAVQRFVNPEFYAIEFIMRALP